MFKRRSEFWQWFLKQDDYQGLFTGEGDRKALFLKYVDVVNIETSAFCNRKCAYCPMSLIDRPQELIDDKVFSKLIDELVEIGYENSIALSLFNEPLADEKLISRIREIHTKLPKCRIQFNSNGDYLTAEMLDELRKAGLNQILFTMHAPANKDYVDEDRLDALKKFLDRVNLSEYYDRLEMTPGKNITIDINEPDWRLLIVCNNWMKYGNGRGGTVEALCVNDRTAPCVNSFREVCVAYDGDYKPCWNIYFGDGVEFGNARDLSILDFFFGEKMRAFRKQAFVFGPKNMWCRTCNTEDNALESEKETRAKIISNIK